MAADQRSEHGSRILIGCSVRAEQHVFDAYYRSLTALLAPRHATLSRAFVADCTLAWPEHCAVLPAPERPSDAAYSVADDTHHWQVATFEHLAQCKQLLLDYAVSSGFTHIMLVDSDLLLEPTTLLSMHACNVDIVNGAFLTAWQPDSQPMPQCWLTHPYEMEGLGMQAHEYAAKLCDHQLVRVAGGGACTLIKTGVLDKVRYHPRLALPQGGMWQGEDRSFAVMAQQQRIRQYADAWPQIYHAYRPADRQQDNLDKHWQRLSAPRQMFAKIGDWVNVRLAAMEDHQLDSTALPEVRNARTRLGSNRLAPELEAVLLDMHVGSSRIVDVQMLPGHPVYPAGVRALQVTLVDARPAA